MIVSTEHGLCRIDTIEEGDYVWSQDTQTGEKSLCQVLKVFVNETDTAVHVTTESGSIIKTTENHPFYVEGKGWVAASELQNGDILRTSSGKVEAVTHVEVIPLENPITVYNLEIEGNHTYYVSAEEVLVHNMCGVKGGKKPNYEGRVKNGNNQPPNNFSPDGAGRNGSFREAKRASGIPNSEQPISVEPARDKSGKLIPGRDYTFSDGKIINEHFEHIFPDDPIQDRKTHFNDIFGNHYDY